MMDNDDGDDGCEVVHCFCPDIELFRIKALSCPEKKADGVLRAVA